MRIEQIKQDGEELLHLIAENEAERHYLIAKHGLSNGASALMVNKPINQGGRPVRLVYRINVPSILPPRAEGIIGG